MALIHLSKDIKWQTALKSKTQLFVAYKKYISQTKTNIGLKGKDLQTNRP
jgi:hypothetical protein